DPELPEHVIKNRIYWDATADDWIAAGERAWRSQEPYWGCCQAPESTVGLLPADMSGLLTIELGCGTGYVSAWMAHRGANVVGIDNSARQLATATRLAAEHGIDLTLHHGNAEQVPYPDQHFDFAISEYGAAIWCDPAVWIPEAYRLLKPGGQLIFLGNAPLALVCTPPGGEFCDTTLHRSYFDLNRLDWTEAQVDPGGIEFNLPISGWFRLFRETGFEVEDFLELRPSLNATVEEHFASTEWARHWPSEQVWKLRRR
ncbi:MAG: methyltransferase domain-containing protein, partial [Myxococcota bacterium]